MKGGLCELLKVWSNEYDFLPQVLGVLRIASYSSVPRTFFAAGLAVGINLMLLPAASGMSRALFADIVFGDRACGDKWWREARGCECVRFIALRSVPLTSPHVLAACTHPFHRERRQARRLRLPRRTRRCVPRRSMETPGKAPPGKLRFVPTHLATCVCSAPGAGGGCRGERCGVRSPAVLAVARRQPSALLLAAQLCGIGAGEDAPAFCSDWHNALKLGYDVRALAYPPWLEARAPCPPTACRNAL